MKKRIEELTAYEVLERKELPDIKSVGWLCRHKKTGAKVALLENDDENKVFYIGFRTPPQDSTGTAHILEHSVLCGSREFPVKDPFVELVKGSLNTFLNAMTYPDKTIYPLASCNDKDFKNLMHVYLDAVFYPNIYQKEAIFRQEGWHYELDEATGELSYNGVVYNEMKGAFSSPDDVLEREIMNSLYPHTAYGWESGGDPAVIPELSYEQFLEFHRTYYHPSNSYIYLYGNLDMAERLEFIDREYLSAFDALEVESAVGLEPAFQEPVRKVREYPISQGESAEENTFLSWNLAVGDSLDRNLYVAFQILDYALCTAPGAPLKQALVDKNIGKDVYSIYENGIRQPFFSVVAKDTSVEKEEEFLSVIRKELEKIVREGFDQKALLAGLNYYEFKYREADYGSTPRGLMYGIQILDSWLYDGGKPFVHMEFGPVFAELRKKAGEGYFEGLVEQFLLNNPHCAVVVLKPVEGLGERQEEELKRRLAEKKGNMTPEELQRIRDTFEDLNAFRETADRPEDLAKLPHLSVEDIEPKAPALVNRETKLGDVPVLHHELETNGIGYLRLVFFCRQIPKAYFPYIGLLKGCLGLLNTERYSYGDLFNEINLVSGGVSAVNNVYERTDDPDRYTVTLELKAKALYGDLEKALGLMEEILLTSDFKDTKRIREILSEGKSRLQSQMISAGHIVAAGRAASYENASGAASEELSGVSFYRLVSDLEEHFEERQAEVTERLETLCRMILRPENLMVDFVGDREHLESLREPVAALCKKLCTEPVEREDYVPACVRKNEGFMTSAQVQYVCRAGNFRKKGLPYRGELKVLKVMMGYEYLWVNVRVRGGAYGCMCSFGRTGDCYFTSYRDPNLGKTLEVYEGAGDYVRSFQADEAVMTQYIIGAVSELDMPLNPAAKGLKGLSAYMTGITDEMIQRERDQVLAADQEKIRRLGDYIDAFMEEDCLCVVGNAGKIKSEEKRFGRTENLF